MANDSTVTGIVVKDIVNDVAKDRESDLSLHVLEAKHKILSKRVQNVKSVLVVLSSRGMAFDNEALRQKILHSYPEATIFFRTVSGKSVGADAPKSVDLLIDFTGPGQRGSLFNGRGLRKGARFAVGRNAGFFRKGSYDRVVDEKSGQLKLPTELLARERFVQSEILESVGIPVAPVGESPPDLGKSIARELPAMKRTLSRQ